MSINEITKIALGQMTSTEDLNKNLEAAEKLIKSASEQQCELISLPENFAYMPLESSDAFSIAEPITGKIISQYADLARKYNIWLSLGGFQTPTQPPSNQLHNTHIIIDKLGAIKASYNKLHLFRVATQSSNHDESQNTKAGTELIVCSSPIGKLGLSICFDLRFPEMFVKMAQAGAQIMLIPAAFFPETGRDHWETLIKARAIESQSYVCAAAQTGTHSPKRSSYGSSMIVDPWGKILAKLDGQQDIVTAEIDLSRVEEVRKSIPVLANRNCDGKIIKK